MKSTGKKNEATAKRKANVNQEPKDKFSYDLLINKILQECTDDGHDLSVNQVKTILEDAYGCKEIKSEGVRSSIDRVRGAYEMMAGFDDASGSNSKEGLKRYFPGDKGVIDNYLRFSTGTEVKEEVKSKSTAPNAKRTYRMRTRIIGGAQEAPLSGEDVFHLGQLLRREVADSKENRHMGREDVDEEKNRCIEDALLGLLNVYDRQHAALLLQNGTYKGYGLSDLWKKTYSLDEVIEKGRYISFDYQKSFEQGADGRVTEAEPERVEKVHPLLVDREDGRLYLVVKAKRSHKAKSGKRIYYRIFRVDRISNMEIGDEVTEAAKDAVGEYEPSPKEFLHSMVEGIPSVDIVDVLVRCVGGKKEVVYLRETFTPNRVYELNDQQKANLDLPSGDSACIISGVSSEGMVRWALKRLSRIEILGDMPHEGDACEVFHDNLCSPRFFEGTLRVDVVEAMKKNVYGLDLCPREDE